MLQTQFQLSTRPMALMLVEGFPPAFGRGGPPVSAANLIATTRDIIDWRVITRNDDAGNTRPITEDGVWLGRDPCVLRTNSYWRMRRAASFAVQRWPIRAVFANSLFAPSTRAAGMSCIGNPNLTLVIFPRGELDPGALLLKRSRKSAFIGALKALKLDSRIVLGTTSELEERHVRRVFPRANSVRIPNLQVDPAVIPYRLDWRQGPTRLVFNSRVSEKKGLDTAIQALLTYDRKIHLDIFGGDSGVYATRCRALAAFAPKHVKITWKGLIPPADLHVLLKEYDAMILPTLGENFGHSIAESLSAGTPVILPDTTPWTPAILNGAGLILESNAPCAIAAALSRFDAMNLSAHGAMRRASRAAALAAHGDSALAAQVRGNLRMLVQGGALEKGALSAGSASTSSRATQVSEP